MIQGCYITHPGSILGTSIFRDFYGPGPKVPVSQGFRSSASNGVDTIGKSTKNYGNPCRVCFVSWISCGDIMDQRESRPPWWRMGSWTFWRPLVTWRRVLRTMFRAKAALNTTAWVLLFESSNHTEACSTIYYS